MGAQSLGEFEQVVLLAVLRLGENAYGVTIRQEIAVRIERDPSPGALYTTLRRLEEKGMIESRLGSSTPERGGRSKRLVKATSSGIAAVARAQCAYQRLLQGIPLPGLARYQALQNMQTAKTAEWRMTPVA